jgi:hypothetical protein
MLKSCPIFKKNGAHLIKEKRKTFKENEDCPLSNFECCEHEKTLKICVKL